jgi:hypothetical protein
MKKSEGDEATREGNQSTNSVLNLDESMNDSFDKSKQCLTLLQSGNAFK